MQFLHPKVSKDATLIMVYARKNSKSPLKVLNPLVMFDEDGKFTPEVNGIYNKCATHSIKCNLENIWLMRGICR